ncbi:hypothetical protein CDAR_589381 [Caerostris darwini]|uniref:Uncharacterized protein n=1 Tax=Caerostris darwini TaxID=1538125 RepID=A0AAV4T7L3_9ARAC|nr:hypothetical protein CDAR_589381 [Caerostris darwini]
MFENLLLHPCEHPPPSFRSGMNDIYLLLLLLWRRYLLSKYSVTVSPHRKGVEKEVTDSLLSYPHPPFSYNRNVSKNKAAERKRYFANATLAIPVISPPSPPRKKNRGEGFELRNLRVVIFCQKEDGDGGNHFLETTSSD